MSVVPIKLVPAVVPLLPVNPHPDALFFTQYWVANLAPLACPVAVSTLNNLGLAAVILRPHELAAPLSWIGFPYVKVPLPLLNKYPDALLSPPIVVRLVYALWYVGILSVLDVNEALPLVPVVVSEILFWYKTNDLVSLDWLDSTVVSATKVPVPVIVPPLNP